MKILLNKNILLLFVLLIFQSHLVAKEKGVKHKAPIIKNPVKHERSVFFFTEVKGHADYWAPLSAKWRKLTQGTKLPVGTLLQISKGSELGYSFYDYELKDWHGDQAYLKINDPVNIRLNRDIMRKVDFKESWQSTIPVVEESDDPKDENYFVSVRNAWEKLVMYFEKTKENENYIKDLYTDAKESVEVGLRAKKIHIVYPGHGAAQFANQYPSELRVVWRVQAKQKPKSPFAVYFWKQKDARPVAPEVYTRASEYRIQVTAEGSYYVQIETQDRKYLSQPHLVHFGQPASSFDRDIVNSKARSIFPKGDIAYILPKKIKRKRNKKDGVKKRIQNRLSNMMDYPKKELRFFWNVSSSVKIAKQRFVLKTLKDYRLENPWDPKSGLIRDVIKDNVSPAVVSLRAKLLQNEVLDIDPNRRTIKLKLNPGLYSWYVEVVSADPEAGEEPLIASTKPYKVNIIPKVDPVKLARLSLAGEFPFRIIVGDTLR